MHHVDVGGPIVLSASAATRRVFPHSNCKRENWSATTRIHIIRHTNSHISTCIPLMSEEAYAAAKECHSRSPPITKHSKKDDKDSSHAPDDTRKACTGTRETCEAPLKSASRHMPTSVR